ncbi:unnamed protein product [Cylicocyclus nassatus]|uniref:Glutaredoxin-related protein 5, mitochondrial n=1 Tax=Cylicocyclus nassatus TaxID=53992 RepID=A0AA36GYQ2_CYLNA|nr:unnamed protein product [Cylicocyclus nassatus]
MRNECVLCVRVYAVNAQKISHDDSSPSYESDIRCFEQAGCKLSDKYKHIVVIDDHICQNHLFIFVAYFLFKVPYFLGHCNYDSPFTRLHFERVSLVTPFLFMKRTECCENKIDNMVKKDDVVVFMKGTQEEPMCGFSRNVKLVLDFHNVKFKDYNVLEDQELREGVKAYSEWPTIPQVFVKGEFVGGCDIVVQMHKDGEISDFFDSKGIPNKYGEKK